MGVRGRHRKVAPTESAGSWKQLRTQYIGSTLSLRALAREAGVSYDALKRRARREGWAAQRAELAVEGRRRRDLEDLAHARADACTAARRLLALPAGASLTGVAAVAREVHLTSGRLWELAVGAE
jgi:hypothetical protein